MGQQLPRSIFPDAVDYEIMCINITAPGLVTVFGKEFAPLRLGSFPRGPPGRDGPRGHVCEAMSILFFGKKLITGFIFDQFMLVLGKGPGSQVVPDPPGHRQGLRLVRRPGVFSKKAAPEPRRPSPRHIWQDIPYISTLSLARSCGFCSSAITSVAWFPPGSPWSSLIFLPLRPVGCGK